MPVGDAALGLDLSQHLGHTEDEGGIRDLGQTHRHDRGAHHCFEVANEQSPGPIDPHDHIAACLRKPIGDRRYTGPRLLFLGRADTVFEIDLQDIGWLAQGAVDESVADGRHEEDRAPHGQGEGIGQLGHGWLLREDGTIR